MLKCGRGKLENPYSYMVPNQNTKFTNACHTLLWANRDHFLLVVKLALWLYMEESVLLATNIRNPVTQVTLDDP